MADELIDREFVEKLTNNDKRWRTIDTAIKLDQELRESIAIKLVLEAVRASAEEALDKLVWADPTDTKLIISLQAQVQRDRIISNTFEAIRTAAKNAHASVQEDGPIEIDDNE